MAPRARPWGSGDTPGWDGTGGRQPKCGFGLAAAPTSCNHSQPLECMGETGEIYLFVVGLCGQWVFLMKTICFCVFPENIIPRGKRYPVLFSNTIKRDECVCVCVCVHTGMYVRCVRGVDTHVPPSSERCAGHPVHAHALRHSTSPLTPPPVPCAGSLLHPRSRHILLNALQYNYICGAIKDGFSSIVLRGRKQLR